MVEQAGKSQEVVQTVSCLHHDICVTAMPGYGYGATRIGMKMSPYCPGKQRARVRITPMLKKYEDGTSESFNRSEIIERLEACK